ncbi:MAG: FliM/FliN family flagellar motor switch protein [Phycisphaeraceae bacterium]|nr:FliM/FliN family flagellar motor switch protein [Phycisphaeraceae bacterium]
MSTDLHTILRLSVPLIVRIGQRTMHMSEVVSLGPGAILELSKSVDEDLDLLVNNKPVARGSAVKVGENFGVRINAVGTAQDRVNAMKG